MTDRAVPVAWLLVGLLLMTFVAALDGTVVGTLMPTVIADLGGLDLYPWVGIGFMLASMLVAPLFGKFSDLLGPRRLTYVAVSLFVLGSLACGLARSMPELIAARAFQGMGGGGIFVMTLIVTGHAFPPAERGRIQGLLASVWGFSSVVGPALGGLIVQYATWRWAFFINLPVGVLAVVMLQRTLHLPPLPPRKVQLDVGGTVLFSFSAIALPVALLQLGQGQTSSPVFALLAAGLLMAAWLVRVELDHPEPLLPVRLFQAAAFRRPVILGFLAAAALFSAATFVPLYVQGVLETSPTVTGMVLTANALGWTLGSAFCDRLIARLGTRTVAMIGMSGQLLGALQLALLPWPTAWGVGLGLGTMGLGMGLVVTTALLAVQSGVERRELGTATSTIQLFRNLGATVGLSALGGLQVGLFRGTLRSGAAEGSWSEGARAALDAAIAHPQQVLEATSRQGLPPELVALLQTALAHSVQGVFGCVVAITMLGVLVAWRLPRGEV